MEWTKKSSVWISVNKKALCYMAFELRNENGSLCCKYTNHGFTKVGSNRVSNDLHTCLTCWRFCIECVMELISSTDAELDFWSRVCTYSASVDRWWSRSLAIFCKHSVWRKARQWNDIIYIINCLDVYVYMYFLFLKRLFLRSRDF